MKRFFVPSLMAALLLAAFLIGSLALATPELKRYEASFLDLFDTYSNLVLYARTKEEASQIAQLVHDELETYHRLFDIYHHYDGYVNLYDVNESAAKAPVAVDERLMRLMTFCRETGELTGGRVNIAMGSVLRVWHEYREEGVKNPEAARLPPMETLREAALHTEIADLVLDEEAGTIFFADPLLKLDVGAVAKGYAVERVAEMLEARGVENALLSIGGNVRAIGGRADGTDFRVAVQNPDVAAEKQALETLNLREMSLVSSGSYQRYYTVDGKTYHHIIDPDTLMPSQYCWAVSVLTKDSGLADALSTALYNLSIEDGQALLKRVGGVEALWVLYDGTLCQTDGFRAFIAP